MADYEALPRDANDETIPEGDEEEHHKCSCKVVAGFAILILAIAGVVYACVNFHAELGQLWNSFLDWCKSLGWLAAVVVAGSTWLATTFGLPASAFFVGSACIFANLYGPTTGAIVAIVSCGVGFWAGCVSAFVVGRSLLKPMVQRKLDHLEAMRAVNMIIEEQGWTFAFLMRLSPFMPVEVFNFACALTSMSFGSNALACLGSVPMASFEIWMYAQVAHAAMKGGQHADKEDASPPTWVMIAINVPIIILLVLVIRHANKKYHEKVDNASKVPGKETLKNRKTIHKTFKKARTIVAVSKALGTHQAIGFTAQSLRGRLATEPKQRSCHRSFTVQSQQAGSWPAMTAVKSAPAPLTP